MILIKAFFTFRKGSIYYSLQLLRKKESVAISYINKNSLQVFIYTRFYPIRMS